jgi:death-on-curing protein
VKPVRLLDFRGVSAIHAELITRYGGSMGLRDAGLLESAIARPAHLHVYEEDASVARLCATLGWGLLKNRAFIDGNKRVALGAMVVFLELNGYELICSEAEETDMVLRAAASEMNEAQWNEWIERVAQAKSAA